MNTGNRNTGYSNTGEWNTGDRNTGNRNTGYMNTGDCNTGNWNTGYMNTGNWNTGDWNAGYMNTGNWNAGDKNTGNRNTGDGNTGDWNTGDGNTGYMNTITPEEILVFNKPLSRTIWDAAEKPLWIHATITKWVISDNMSEKEKKAYPSYVTTGGYVKSYTCLKHAYVDAWEKADKEDRDKTKSLPNFDIDVFTEIFGFNPFKEEKKEVTLKSTEYKLNKIKQIINKIKQIINKL